MEVLSKVEPSETRKKTRESDSPGPGPYVLIIERAKLHGSSLNLAFLPGSCTPVQHTLDGVSTVSKHRHLRQFPLTS